MDDNNKFEGNGGADSDIEVEDGKEFEEATVPVEAMYDKIQANALMTRMQ
jgi:hypothetical protein